MLTLMMFNNTDFLYDPLPGNIQAGISDTDPMLIQLATAQNDWRDGGIACIDILIRELIFDSQIKIDIKISRA